MVVNEPLQLDVEDNDDYGSARAAVFIQVARAAGKSAQIYRSDLQIRFDTKWLQKQSKECERAAAMFQ